MSEEDGKRGGRPSGSGPRQAEARAIAESVGKEISRNVETALQNAMTGLADTFKIFIDNTRLAETPNMQSEERLIAELGMRLASLEAILERLALSSHHDAAVAVQRTDDINHLLTSLESELAGKRKQDDIASRFNYEILEGLNRKIEGLAPAAAEHSAAAVLAALMPLLVGTARESSVVDGLTKLKGAQERQHAELMVAIKEAKRAPTPKLDEQTMRRNAIERALADVFKIFRHTKPQTHPAEFIVERYCIGSSVTIEKMADSQLRVWIGAWKVTKTGEGWSPNEFSEVADRAVAAVEAFQRKPREPKLAIVVDASGRSARRH